MRELTQDECEGVSGGDGGSYQVGHAIGVVLGTIAAAVATGAQIVGDSSNYAM